MRDIRLDDPGFLRRDLRDAFPQNFDMVKTDICANRQDRRQDISGVEPPAKANLDDGDINFLVAEIFEGESGDYFKEREFFFTSTLRYRSTNDWIARSVIGLPFTCTRSRKLTRCGDV